MTIDDGFEATFRLPLDRNATWARLTAARHQDGTAWLPGFDAMVRITEAEEPSHLRATKVDEPCAGTDIVVTLADDATGTVVRVVQSRFGDWLAAARDAMAVGWRFIVADLQTFLATGVNARRHLRPWGDLGADASAVDGGLGIAHVRDGGLAQRLGLAEGDLLTALAGAPVAALDDLVAVLRAVPPSAPIEAEWVRAGRLLTASAVPTVAK